MPVFQALNALASLSDRQTVYKFRLTLASRPGTGRNTVTGWVALWNSA